MEKSARFLAACLALFGLWLAGCETDPGPAHTYLRIKVDTSWRAYDTVRVFLADSAGNAPVLLYEGKLSPDDSVLKVRADSYRGQRVRIYVRGSVAGRGEVFVLVYHYDGTGNPAPKDTLVDKLLPSLASLKVSKGSLAPPFSPKTVRYTLALDSADTAITLTATAADSAVTIRVEGQILPGALSQPIPIGVGMDSIIVQITALDGGAKTYVINTTRAIPDDVYGYVLSGNSAAATDSAVVSYNPAAQPVLITRLVTGQYKVSFKGMGALSAARSNVQVSAADSATYCKIEGWTETADLDVRVNCFDAAGLDKDSRFSLLAHYPRKVGTQAFFVADDEDSVDYSPDPAFFHNSSGGDIRASRTNEGMYHVSVKGVHPGIAELGSFLAVAHGRRADKCKPAKWLESGPDITLLVECYNEQGILSNTRFTAAWTQMGPAYLAYVNVRSLVSGTIDDLMSHNASGSITSTHASLGQYRVTFEGMGSIHPDRKGVALVGATGEGTGTYCNVGTWGGSPDVTVNVSCHNPDGTAADSPFNVWFVK